jgi:hypothetical protein
VKKIFAGPFLSYHIANSSNPDIIIEPTREGNNTDIQTFIRPKQHNTTQLTTVSLQVPSIRMIASRPRPKSPIKEVK